MSEKIYAFLLRLYPTHFRKAYGEEALQLFRDRTRDESGFLASLRLWLDLLGDLAVSLPREYRSISAVVASQTPSASAGTPLFRSLEDETLSVHTLLCAALLSLTFCTSISLLIGHVRSSFLVPAPYVERGPKYSGSFARPQPTVILSCSPATPAPGSTVTLTATVNAVGAGPIPTGYLRFFDGDTPLNFGKLNRGTIILKGKLSNGAQHSLNALYYGDPTYRPASSDRQ